MHQNLHAALNREREKRESVVDTNKSDSYEMFANLRTDTADKERKRQTEKVEKRERNREIEREADKDRNKLIPTFPGL